MRWSWRRSIPRPPLDRCAATYRHDDAALVAVDDTLAARVGRSLDTDPGETSAMAAGSRTPSGDFSAHRVRMIRLAATPLSRTTAVGFPARGDLSPPVR